MGGRPCCHGGELAPDKSFCYLLDYKWANDRWSYCSLTGISGNVTMNDKHGHPHPLQCLDTDAAEKTLGVFIAMDGNQKRHTEYLTNISTTFGCSILHSLCPKNHTLYTFSALYMKSIEYSLPLTCLPLSTWDKIIRPAVLPSLQKAGISKTSPRVPLFAPPLYGGFG